MSADSKGILKPSRFSAHVDEPAAHADEGDATPSATQTTHYKEFHSRVADVFANLGPGICGSGSTGGGSDPTGSHQSPAEAVWMPANTTVTRRGARDDYSDDDDDDEDGRIGRPKRNGNDDSSDDSRDDPSDEDDEEDRPTFDHTASNAEVSEVRRQRQKARWAEDLDCLESDEEGDDDQKKMAKLGRSVGRCSALNDEEEFDCYDTLAMTGMNRRQPMDRNGEGGIDVARIRRLVEGNDDEFEEDDADAAKGAGFTKVLASNEYERRILAREGKDAPDDDDDDDDDDEDTPDEAAAAAAGVGAATVDPVADGAAAAGRRKRGGFGGAYVPPNKRMKGEPGAAPSRGVAWDDSVPEVTRPKFGGSRGRGGGRGRGRGVPDHVKNPHKYTCYTLDEPLTVGGGGGVGEGVKEMEAARRAASAAAAARDATPNERSLPAAPTEKPVFQLSAAAAARRDARRGEKKETGSATVAGVKIDFAHDDEDEEGGAEDANRSGLGGSKKRARNFRKKAAEDD